MTKFIGFSGHKQTGKDTCANLLVQHFDNLGGIKVEITYFAEALKDMCIDILGLRPEGVYGNNARKNTSSHIKWEDMPQEIRFQYANEFGFSSRYGDSDGVPKPRSGFMTNREVLQIFGTDIFRRAYPTVWVDALFRKDWSETDYVLIPDVRFPDELLAIEQHGGIIIRLERNTGLKDDHISETALDKHNFMNKINNNGTIKELEAKLLEIIDGL